MSTRFANINLWIQHIQIILTVSVLEQITYTLCYQMKSTYSSLEVDTLHRSIQFQQDCVQHKCSSHHPGNGQVNLLSGLGHGFGRDQKKRCHMSLSQTCFVLDSWSSSESLW